jgi:hypothetical protein
MIRPSLPPEAIRLPLHANPPSSCSRLPAEIIVQIIEIVGQHDAPKSITALCLRQTALVCKSWTATSQRALFHSVKIEERDMCVGGRLEFLGSRPDLAACVKQVA